LSRTSIIRRKRLGLKIIFPATQFTAASLIRCQFHGCLRQDWCSCPIRMTDPVAAAVIRREHDANPAAPISGLLGDITGRSTSLLTHSPHIGKTSLDLVTGARNQCGRTSPCGDIMVIDRYSDIHCHLACVVPGSEHLTRAWNTNPHSILANYHPNISVAERKRCRHPARREE
jgi:hypothetical protein